MTLNSLNTDTGLKPTNKTPGTGNEGSVGSYDQLSGLAIVIIGRNEGRRLTQCLESVVGKAWPIVYVDSGSTDSSCSEASGHGAVVVSLDTDSPFTAARARNEGYKVAIQIAPDTAFIQFIDGDCAVSENWLARAHEYLIKNSYAAAVCGRRRERFPERSIYNELCDSEWDVPAGNAKYFGGDVMIRSTALQETNGYRNTLIAGEEPELSFRLRELGWKIQVLPYDMTMHDADMLHLRQWWVRMKRSGYAYAAGARLHGHPPEYHFVWRAIQPWIWVPGVLVMTIALLAAIGYPAIAALMIYPIQTIRLYWKTNGNSRKRLLIAIACTFSKFPEFAGQLRFWSDHFRNKAAELVEYK